MKKIILFMLIFLGLANVNAIDLNETSLSNSTRGGASFEIIKVNDEIQIAKNVDLVTSNPLVNRIQARYLQKELNLVMNCNLDTDGLIGPLSKNCIRAFQQKYELTVDGIPGPQTRKKLNELYLQDKVIVNANTLNIRDNAGTSGTNVLTSVTKGDILTVLDETTVNGVVWYHIIYNDIEGYVISTYVKTTFIEIDIISQTLRLYKDKVLFLDTPITSGRADGEYDSHKGYFKILHMWGDINSTGDYKFSMPYYSGERGETIHDSSWRGETVNFDHYGGTVYKNLNYDAGNSNSGSHGCINTPLPKVALIFDNVTIGTAVYVH